MFSFWSLWKKLLLQQSSKPDRVTELRNSGLLEEQSFQALRAFEVKEYEDEGRHFFLELADGSILYLNGQYLYDYDATRESPEVATPETFPSTEFTIVRHKTEGYVVEILPQGRKLVPEKRFKPDHLRAGREVFDGDIIRDCNYDELFSHRGEVK
jgi:hypothetical protein